MTKEVLITAREIVEETPGMFPDEVICAICGSINRDFEYTESLNRRNEFSCKWYLSFGDREFRCPTRPEQNAKRVLNDFRDRLKTTLVPGKIRWPATSGDLPGNGSFEGRPFVPKALADEIIANYLPKLLAALTEACEKDEAERKRIAAEKEASRQKLKKEQLDAAVVKTKAAVASFELLNQKSQIFADLDAALPQEAK